MSATLPSKAGSEAIIHRDSFITLHYALSILLPDGQEEEVVSTFDWSPATFLLTDGQLAEPLLACLIGQREMPSGAPPLRFVLPYDHGFGPYNPRLLETFRRTALPADLGVEPHSLVQFTDEHGRDLSGFVRDVDEERVCIDFNHPLAGKTVVFRAQIIAVL